MYAPQDITKAARAARAVMIFVFMNIASHYTGYAVRW